MSRSRFIAANPVPSSAPPPGPPTPAHPPPCKPQLCDGGSRRFLTAAEIGWGLSGGVIDRAFVVAAAELEHGDFVAAACRPGVPVRRFLQLAVGRQVVAQRPHTVHAGPVERLMA